MEKKKRKRSTRHIYSDEEMKFLKDNVSGVSNKELVDKFNKKFNLNQTLESIKGFKAVYGLHSGIKGFEKCRVIDPPIKPCA